MYRITKQIVNGANNVITEDFIGYVDCNSHEFATRVAPKYHNLAKANTLCYKDRGQSLSVKYVFECLIVADIDSIIRLADGEINARIIEANNYIDFLNKTVKLANKRNHRNDNYGVREYYKSSDFKFGDNCEINESDYKVIVG